MRALAVSSVFLCHLGGGFGAAGRWQDALGGIGRCGVVLFFVHTSLVLMQALERLSATGRPFILEFYARRAFRIYPLAICAIFGALLLQIPPDWGQSVTYRSPSLATVASNVLLIQNALRQPSVISPLWSLPIEVQMYVALPFLFLFFSSRKDWVWPMVIGWGLALEGALALFFRTGHMNLFAYVPCFLSGVIAYRQRSDRRLPFFLWPCLIACLLAIGAAFFTTRGENWNLAWEWPVSLTIGLTWRWFAKIRPGALSRFSTLVANYSYGIYLWHYVVMVLVFQRLHVPGSVAILLTLAGTAAAAVASFHGVEAPLIRAGKRFATLLSRPHAPQSAISGRRIAALP